VVSRKTGRPVGRPRKVRPPPLTRAQKLERKFLTDPDRFAIALLDAMLALEMGSERACSLAIATMQVGVEAKPAQICADRPWLLMTNWWRKPTRKGSRSGTLEGRSMTLRFKRRRIRSAAETVWRKNMASAIMLALTTRDRRAAVPLLFERVCKAQDSDPRVLLALLAMIGAPEFRG
jgi:hypothetical protein